MTDRMAPRLLIRRPGWDLDTRHTHVHGRRCGHVGRPVRLPDGTQKACSRCGEPLYRHAGKITTREESPDEREYGWCPRCVVLALCKMAVVRHGDIAHRVRVHEEPPDHRAARVKAYSDHLANHGRIWPAGGAQ